MQLFLCLKLTTLKCAMSDITNHIASTREKKNPVNVKTSLQDTRNYKTDYITAQFLLEGSWNRTWTASDIKPQGCFFPWLLDSKLCLCKFCEVVQVSNRMFSLASHTRHCWSPEGECFEASAWKLTYDHKLLIYIWTSSRLHSLTSILISVSRTNYC